MTATQGPSLSEREHATLLALADLGELVYGDKLAERMRANGRATSLAAAHQAANALDRKGLAAKRYAKQQPVRYEISEAGLELLAADPANLIRHCCAHCEHSPDEQPSSRTAAYRHDTPCPHGCPDTAGEGR